MAYVGGLYTGASKASADEAKRFREFQTDIDAMSARERAGLYRRDQAAMDQFTAGLKPQSNVAIPDWTAPSAPPAAEPYKAATGGGADSGAAASSSYERDRLMQERKRTEEQLSAEATAQRTYLENLGKQKSILEQQLTAAPPYMVDRIRRQIIGIDAEINTRVNEANTKISALSKTLKDIDKAVRLGDLTAPGSGLSVPGYTPAGTTAEEQGPDFNKTSPSIYAPDEIGDVPLVRWKSPGSPRMAGDYTPITGPVPGTAAAAAPPTPTSNESWVGKIGGIVRVPGFGNLTIPQVGEYDASTPAGRGVDRGQAEKAFNFALDTARRNWYTGGYGNPMPNLAGSAFGVFADVGPEADARTKSYAVSEWLNSSATEKLVRSDIEAFKAVIADPEAAYDKYKDQTNLKAAPAAAPAPQAGLAAQKQPAAPATTPIAQAQALIDAGGADLANIIGAGTAPEALTQAEDVPLGTSPRAKAIMQYSDGRVQERLPQLVDSLGTYISSDRGQDLLAKADFVGVDRAATIAAWGIETTFGTNVGTSGAGAGGQLQVTPAQFANIKKFYNDPAERARYKIPEKLTQLANSITSNTDDYAGLLQLKMAELIGLEKNLWGAGYQGNMWEVKKEKRPLAVHDAGKTGVQGMTNSDYNKMFVELYNNARVMANTPVSSGGRGTGQSYQQEQLDLKQKNLEAQYNDRLAFEQQKYARRVAERDRLAKQLQYQSAYGTPDEAMKISDAIAALEDETIAANEALRLEERALSASIQDINLERTKEYIITSAAMLQAGRPEPFQELLVNGTGMEVQIMRIGDTTNYAVIEEGRLISPPNGWSPKQVLETYRPMIDGDFRARQAELEKENRALKGEIAKNEADFFKQATLEQIKGAFELAKEDQKKGWSVPSGGITTDPETNEITEMVFTHTDGRTMRMYKPPKVELDGLQTTGGFLTEVYDRLGVKQ